MLSRMAVQSSAKRMGVKLRVSPSLFFSPDLQPNHFQVIDLTGNGRKNQKNNANNLVPLQQIANESASRHILKDIELKAPLLARLYI
ncbi:hypothetical protein JS565_00290 [Salmonella enterica subsp. enterica serovar Senftenberg]|nr:hypothetical protein [Salmonella enterica subsp. enterica serovar Senftenberg]